MTEPNLPTLCDETFWAIINDEISDDIVNRLVWHCLGYRYDGATQTWDGTEVESRVV